MTSSLAIFGDSWGCGSWSSNNQKLETGDGYFSKALSKHYVVQNFSKGGLSNRAIRENLINFCKTENYKEFKFLVIQTDPLRDILESEIDWETGDRLFKNQIGRAHV